MALVDRALDLGALLATSYEIGGDRRVRLRLARPSDVPLVSDFLAGGSGEAPDELVRRFTFYDPRERVVLAATMLADGRERIVALGDAAFTDLPEVVLDDELENSGLADLMADAVAYYTRVPRVRARRSAA
jgi:hypothetical protein